MRSARVHSRVSISRETLVWLAAQAQNLRKSRETQGRLAAKSQNLRQSIETQGWLGSKATKSQEIEKIARVVDSKATKSADPTKVEILGVWDEDAAALYAELARLRAAHPGISRLDLVALGANCAIEALGGPFIETRFGRQDGDDPAALKTDAAAGRIFSCDRAAADDDDDEEADMYTTQAALDAAEKDADGRALVVAPARTRPPPPAGPPPKQAACGCFGR